MPKKGSKHPIQRQGVRAHNARAHKARRTTPAGLVCWVHPIRRTGAAFPWSVGRGTNPMASNRRSRVTGQSTMKLTDQYIASANHAIEGHVAICLMFAETRWRRSVTNMPRERILEEALRECCEELARRALERGRELRGEDRDPS